MEGVGSKFLRLRLPVPRWRALLDDPLELPRIDPLLPLLGQRGI